MFAYRTLGIGDSAGFAQIVRAHGHAGANGVPASRWVEVPVLVSHELQQFVRDNQGSELVEWSVLTIIILLGTIGVLGLIFPDALAGYFDQVMVNLGLHRAW